MTDRNSQQNIPIEEIDPGKFQEMVAACAYCKAEKRGFESGHALEDWLEAEQEVSNQYNCSSRQAE